MKINDNGINRDMTEAEETAHLATLAKYAKECEAQTKAEAARQSAKDAVLAKLGLSADELAALLGA